MLDLNHQSSFDDNVSDDCSLEIGAILSIVATLCFYLCTIILCCMPRPDPCLRKKPIKEVEEKEVEEDASQPPTDWEPQTY
jgi:hypothetical protein